MAKSARTVIKEVPYARAYSDGTILLKELRLSHPHVLIAKAMQNEDGTMGSPSFSVVGMMPKKTHKQAKDLVQARIAELLKENKVAMLPADKKFLRDGEPEVSGKIEYAGHWIVSAREQESRPPSVRAADGRTVLTPANVSVIYGGCYGNLLIRPWFQSNKWGKRVNAGITAVQFLRDGEPFGEGRISEEAIDETFDDEAEEGSGFDMSSVDDL